ncbi:hypothetical protein L9F63_017179, partial [Diploptera punctata]
DFLLSKYSVIIVDEAHERTLYTDILIGFLSRIVALRNKKNNPLKLIVMSATLKLEDFTKNPRLFKITPPVIKVESRQFPVTVHFNKQTATNYVTEAFKKTCKIHNKLPEGGILIFLTGQQEIDALVRKLQKSFPARNVKNRNNNSSKSDKCLETENCSISDEEEIEMDMKRAIQNDRKAKKKHNKDITLPEINLDNYAVVPGDDSEADLVEESDEDEDAVNLIGSSTCQPLWVLPLYSLLPSHKQAMVFKPPPEGSRLCVVATNVAETSLTIPNVKYVVDCGKVKSRLYDKVTGVSKFVVTWCSKAAANQRAGRAGRMGPGHCYRLYSSAVFEEQFAEYTVPEMQRKPLDDIVLQLKSMSIDIVVNFPFPSPPDLQQLMFAERRLVLLGALEKHENKGDGITKVTDLGYAISAYPVAPRFGKMLALSNQHELLPYTLFMVAALSVQQVLLEVRLNDEKEPEYSKRSRANWTVKRKEFVGIGNSLLLGDPMVLLRAVGAAIYSGKQGNFCADYGLRYKAVEEIKKLRWQLTKEVNSNLPELNLSIDPKMPLPSDIQCKLLRQIMLAGMPDQVARKMSKSEFEKTGILANWRYAYRCTEMEEPVFMHPSSVFKESPPEWVVYQEVIETSKMYMKGITAIEPGWLPIYAHGLCNLSAPLDEPLPRFDEKSEKMYCYVTGTFGRAGLQLPIMQIEFPRRIERFKWFACFLLEGKVCPKLKKYTASLLSTPITMVKSWAKTGFLQYALRAREVDSKSKLLEAWKKDSTYLLAAYLKWIPESAHNEVALGWPPIG